MALNGHGSSGSTAPRYPISCFHFRHVFVGTRSGWQIKVPASDNSVLKVCMHILHPATDNLRL
jgi:hypothetical protein